MAKIPLSKEMKRLRRISKMKNQTLLKTFISMFTKR